MNWNNIYEIKPPQNIDLLFAVYRMDADGNWPLNSLVVGQYRFGLVDTAGGKFSFQGKEGTLKLFWSEIELPELQSLEIVP